MKSNIHIRSTERNCFVLKEKKDTSKDGKGSIDDSAFEALERDFQEVRSLDHTSYRTIVIYIALYPHFDGRISYNGSKSIICINKN